MQHGHVLAGGDLAGSQGAGVGEDLVVAGQVVPERHVQQTTAGLGEAIQLGVIGDDAAHVEAGHLHGALEEVRVENLGDDYVGNLGSHGCVTYSVAFGESCG